MNSSFCILWVFWDDGTAFNFLKNLQEKKNRFKILMKHLDIKIFGFVQRVFFRANAKKKAQDLQITGFIRNEPDGTVYIEAEGKKENLQDFLDWCKNGPPMAFVEKVESEYSPKLQKFSDFTVE